MTSLIDRVRHIRRFGYHAFTLHIAQKVACLTVGRAFVSREGQWLRRAAAALPPQAPDVADLAIAVVVHAYYPELLDEALACLRVLPPGTPLLVTVPPDRRAKAEAAVAGIAGATVFETANQGRDIAPFLTLLNAGALDGFDAVLKVHTKRSPHLLDGDIRRRLLFLMLCGEQRATRRALAAFRDPAVGMVGWAASYRAAPSYWMANRGRIAMLAQQMSAGQHGKLGFFEGSMFWCRPSAFAPLRGLALEVKDFEPEQGQTDGTLHHAIERCFTIAAWTAGFTVHDLKGRLLTGGELAWEGAEPAVPAIAQSPAEKSPL